MADKAIVERLKDKALEIREDLLGLSYQSGMTHLGGDLSLVEVAVCLYQHVLKYDPKNPKWEGRDWFFLSKGHSGECIYMCQAQAGFFDKQEIYDTYCKLDSRFGVHPCTLVLNTFEISSGSLGHGLAIAIGAANGLRMNGNKKNRVFVVQGDGECQEGTVWEGFMAAPQFKLGNLCCIIDRNRLSIDGCTEDIMALEPLADKLRAFRWNVIDIDGNDMAQVVDAFEKLPDPDSDVPTLIISRTTKGKGVDFMENNPHWHAGMIKDEATYKDCLRQVREARQREREAK
jgi:transketolase